VSKLRDNPVRAALRVGQAVTGTMVVEMRSTAVPPLLRQAGFDFMYLDTEHGVYDMATMADIVRVARLVGLPPIVRVPDAEYHLIARTLDAGAMGIMVPRVETREQVESIVAASRFPPLGSRGCSTGKGNSDFVAAPFREFADHANDNILVVLQIERSRAVDHIDELLSVPGVDAAVIGPVDLSLSLGVDDIHDSRVEKAIGRVVESAAKHRIASGIHVRDLPMIRYWREKGMTMLAYSSDLDFLTSGSNRAASDLRDIATINAKA